MEDFTRIDIYDTKGIEYLFVIGYLLVLIVFWKIAKSPQAVTLIKRAIGNVSADALNIPQGIFFSKFHTWTHLAESGEAKVGLDDFLRKVTGKMKFTKLKKPGEIIEKGELLTILDQDGKQLEVFSPITGTIMDTNSLLNEGEEMTVGDPYESGWVYKIKPLNWTQETDSYLLAEEASDWATSELTRFKDFLAGEAMKRYSSKPSMILLQDGGEVRENVLSELPEDVWENFQEKFLKFS